MYGHRSSLSTCLCHCHCLQAARKSCARRWFAADQAHCTTVPIPTATSSLTSHAVSVHVDASHLHCDSSMCLPLGQQITQRSRVSRRYQCVFIRQSSPDSLCLGLAPHFLPTPELAEGFLGQCGWLLCLLVGRSASTVLSRRALGCSLFYVPVVTAVVTGVAPATS